MFIIKLTIFCLAVAVVHSQQKWKCILAEEKEVDNLVSLLFTIGRKDRRFPLDNTEMKDYCKDHKKYLQKLEGYKDQCLKEKSKQIIAIIIYSIKTMVNNYCRNIKAKRTQDLLRSAKCANTNSDTYQECQVKFIDVLMEIKLLKDGQSREKLEQFCCGYIDGLNCIRAAATKSGCNDKHIDANLDFIRGYFDGAINTICGDYNEHNDKCDKVQRLKPRDHKNRPKSIFQPAVDVLLSF